MLVALVINASLAILVITELSLLLMTPAIVKRHILTIMQSNVFSVTCIAYHVQGNLKMTV